jgi:neutral ceramidase
MRINKMVFGLLFLLLLSIPGFGQSAQNGWKAGVARMVITPKQQMWMGGFAARTHPSDGALHDLWAKAVALEDASGKKAVMITMDLVGIPKAVSDHVRDQIKAKYGLGREQIMLSTSHTHSGPVLENALTDIYPLDEAQTGKITAYSRLLETQLIRLTGDALKKMEPVTLHAESGVTRFQVNRRNNPPATLAKVTDLNGPNDYAVPVIKLLNGKGKLKAIIFSYACHPVVLDGYQFSGDYAGFAQLELEKTHPGAQAMFFQGAGADQNPLPRGSVALARQYGKELAAAVDRVLEEKMKPLDANLSMAYSEADLLLTALPSESELSTMANESKVPYYKRWASRMLEKQKRGENAPASYPYPVQVWNLGGQPLMALGGELVVEYGIRIRQLFGLNTFVMGYANDVMGYIPSATILAEGGYEGATSQMVYGMPGPWHASIEETILSEVRKVAEQAGVKAP